MRSCATKVSGVLTSRQEKNAFDKYIFTQFSDNTIVRLRYGENSPRREEPEKFRQDRKAIFTAASKAQAAVDYLQAQVSSSGLKPPPNGGKQENE